MQPGKFISIYNTLDSKERKAFRAFLEAPYPHSKPLLLELYDLVCVQESDAPEDRPLYWQELYRGQNRPYRDDHMRKHLSDLAKELELFLSMERFLAKPEQIGLHLLKELSERQLDKYFKQNLGRHSKLISPKDRHPEAADYHHAVETQWINYEFNIPNHRQGENLDGIMEALDHYYVLRGLKVLAEKWSTQFVLSRGNEGLEHDHLLALARRPPFCNHPLVRIYLAILDLFLERQAEKNSLDTLKQVLKLLHQHAAELTPDESGYLHNFAINYAIGIVNRGSGQLRQEALSITAGLQGSAIRNKITHVNGFLPEFLFKNYITNLLNSQQFEEAKASLQELSSQLDPRVRQKALTYNQAAYHYYVKDYGEARILLQQSNLDDEFYALDARTILIKTYLEQGDFPALDSALKAHQKWLQRNKRIEKNRIKRHLNRVHFLIRLVAAVDHPSIKRSKLEALEKDVVDEQRLIDRDYLLSQIRRFLLREG